jgi:IclR family acetate operon transcriptional repressor
MKTTGNALKNHRVKKAPQSPFIQSLDRGLAILQTVALSKQPVTLSQLADLLKIDRSSAFRLAQTLRRRGFLHCPSGRKDYILGSLIWTLSHQYDWSNMLVMVASGHLKRLASDINETAHLAVREDKHALFVDSANANNVLAVAEWVGDSLPLYCTAHGKALLADADERELRSLFGSDPLKVYTKNTITTIDLLAKDCTLIKKRGFALDESEYHEGLRCIAAPIRIQNGAIVGSIGISAPLSRFPKAQSRNFATQICKAAEDIGKLLCDAESSLEVQQGRKSVRESGVLL